MSGSFPQFVHTADHDGQNEFALTAQQLDGVVDPAMPIRALIGRKPARTFINRAYLVWRDDPEFARIVNDRLAGKATD